MINKTRNNRPWTYKGIAGKLISATILFSSAITLVITVFHLYEKYRYDISLIDSRFAEINAIHLSSLRNNLWLADKKELQVHLNGILKIPDIQYLEVYDKNRLWASAGVKKEKNVKIHIYPMTYPYKGKTLNIGSLKVDINLDNVYRNVYKELWVTLAANGIKTFLVAFFMLFLFHKLAIRHLHKIAENVDHFDINQPDKELKLDRKGNSASNRDELDLLVDAFNKLQKQLKLLFSSMEKEVEHRTKELITSKEEAIRANSAKTEFLSQMSHELRTPMNAVLGFAQLLEMDESLNQIQKENAGEILIAGNHLLELINEVLDLSKIESGKSEIILEPIIICNVIMESVSLVRPLLEKKNIRLTWDSHKKNNWTISAERFRLKEVIINLLSNAIKYNSNNGEIIINCEVHDDVLRLNISDTGPGLSAEQQQQIFEPFNRAGAENTSIEGAGIGLTITKRLTHLMGGEIGVISNVGSGCCFFVEFKLIEA